MTRAGVKNIVFASLKVLHENNRTINQTSVKTRKTTIVKSLYVICLSEPLKCVQTTKRLNLKYVENAFVIIVNHEFHMFLSSLLLCINRVKCPENTVNSKNRF